MLILQILITGAVFWYLGQRLDMRAVVTQISALAPMTLLAAILLYCFQLLIVSYRLLFALRVVGGACFYGSAVQAVLTGAFFSQTPVSSIGGDVARIWFLSRGGVSLRMAASSVTLDRLFGFIALFLIMLLALPALWQHLTDPTLRSGVISVVVIAILGLVAFLALQKMPKVLRRFRVMDWVGQVSSEFEAVLRSKAKACLILGLAVSAHLLSMAIFYIFARDVGAQISFLQVCYLAPFPLLAAFLPISVGGWGVREGAMVVAFGLIGVPEATSLSVSILFGLLSLFMALPGGLIWLITARRLRRLANAEGPPSTQIPPSAT